MSLSVPAAATSVLALLVMLAISSYPGPSITGGPPPVWWIALTAVALVLVATLVAQAARRQRMATMLALVQFVSAAALVGGLLVWMT